MRIKLPVWTLSFGLALAVAPFSLSAQEGTLTGTVSARQGGFPVEAVIQIQGGGETRTVTANAQGQYSIQLPAGTYRPGGTWTPITVASGSMTVPVPMFERKTRACLPTKTSSSMYAGPFTWD